jgi:hypothetical protein
MATAAMVEWEPGDVLDVDNGRVHVDNGRVHVDNGRVHLDDRPPPPGVFACRRCWPPAASVTAQLDGPFGNRRR